MDKSRRPAERSAALIEAMTAPEKFAQLVGSPGIVAEIPSCYGARHVPGIARLGIPTLRITNGPVGIGQNDCVPVGLPGGARAAMMSPQSAKATALPSAIAVAASFDPDIAFAFGDTIGREARALALHVLEAPGINLARVPQAGRNFEYFGEDPFLTGTMAVREIQAVQGHGVIAMAKHFVANEQETNRMSVNEIIDDRVLRELYLLPFEMAVKQGDVSGIMCSYNRVNGPFACEDTHHLTDVLRTQWGFQGYVQSDFFAAHATAGTLLAGMDHEMPGMPDGSREFFTPQRLQAALDAGDVRMADIDRALARRYTQMFKRGIFDRAVAQTPIAVARDGEMARRIGEQSAVLLKNEGGLLPLRAARLRSIALIGKAAYVKAAVSGCCGGSSDVIPLRTVSPLQGLQQSLARLGSAAKVELVVVDDDNANLADAAARAKAADVVVVVAGTIAEEGHDLASIALPAGQDAMIEAIAAANARTIVVLKDNASVVLPWIGRVAAVMETWFPGQEDGAIMSRLLFGQAVPSGKLPVTFPMTLADTPLKDARQWPGVDDKGEPVQVVTGGPVIGEIGRVPQPTRVEYSEGLEMGYRWYDAQGVKPLFPFGYGLSYTSFQLSDLKVTPRASDGHTPIAVTVTVRNAGRRTGAETPQVYLRLPASAQEPGKRLVGFQKLWLKPGERRTVTIRIDPNAANHPLGIWSKAEQAWKTVAGSYNVEVGPSSDTMMQSSLDVETREK